MRYELPAFVLPAGLTFLLLLVVGLAVPPLQALAGFTPTPTPTEIPTATPTTPPPPTSAPPHPEPPTPTPVPLLPESGGGGLTIPWAIILTLGAMVILAGWVTRRRG